VGDRAAVAGDQTIAVGPGLGRRIEGLVASPEQAQWLQHLDDLSVERALRWEPRFEPEQRSIVPVQKP
jgi:hypothetical protein